MREEICELDYPDDFLSIIRNGLDETSSPKQVIVAGGGMAGLVAASLLKQAGHQVTILEGNNRIGGRVHTVRQPFSAGNYLDVGAMRIPDNHELVLEYIKKFRLPVNSFMNSSPDDLILANNVLTTRKEYEENPDILNFPVNEDEKGKTALELLLEATQPFLDLYEESSPEEQERLEEEYANYSMGDFLQFNPLGKPLSLTAIRSIGVMLGIEGFPNFSFVDILTDIIYPIFSKTVEFFEIEGGNDYLPYSFLKELRPNIHLNQKVERIDQTGDQVRVQTRNPQTGEMDEYEGDYAIVTVPFPVFQFIDVVPYHSLSFEKWKAIRELTNVPAIKIGIEFKSRFWEDRNAGNAVSDRTTRFSYIPSHGVGSKGPAVMLASYSWGDDAIIWSSVPSEVMTREVLKDLAKVYGDIVYKEYMQTVAYNWSLNPYSAGCFTLFSPGQEDDYSEIIRRPEGRLHFAGEHTSSFHGWIEGAIESGIRAACEVNAR
ncbi:flavin monoamine oxidase family protein [Halobacillus sp. A5]|uniref:flavin monoamine oxidase family protein n=1 Tax=Halobacillus sp. A5 TaxID=2880263 RepID=UPI0020A6971E|nr:flavin monoamine oxidase family protein [Halobacillus sp. A5]MCP3027768.1 flavin monoamine oxidase family protein [Halobacillus sp. A5]